MTRGRGDASREHGTMIRDTLPLVLVAALCVTFLAFCTKWVVRSGPLDGGGDADADVESDGSADARTDTDIDEDRDQDRPGDPDEDDEDGDLDGDREVDADDDDSPCPPDMVLIPQMDPDLITCIDRYEAATEAGGKVASARGRMPWVNVTWNEALGACTKTKTTEYPDLGKRLCTPEEWRAACLGRGDYEAPAEVGDYPYGPTYDDDACNGNHGMDGEVLETGSMVACEGGVPGLFDMSGNVAEWTNDCTSGCAHRGGSHVDGQYYLRCVLRFPDGRLEEVRRLPSGSAATLGFRCCLTLPIE